MKDKKISLIRYSGNKLKFSESFNSLIENNKCDCYCEPFLGSGAIFLNLKKEFKHYFLVEKNEHVYSIWKAFKLYKYNEFKIISDFVCKHWNLRNKEEYYNFRDYYNKNWHNSSNDLKGFYLYFLANSCINSMLRFGPNGMNQSYGNRLTIVTKKVYNLIYNKLQKANLILDNFKNHLDYEDCLYFFDPPYIERVMTYNNLFCNNDLKILINNLPNNYIYTDTENELNKNLDKNLIRKMKNTAPSKKSEITKLEYYYIKLNKEVE